jgi:hypothetical protein
MLLIALLLNQPAGKGKIAIANGNGFELLATPFETPAGVAGRFAPESLAFAGDFAAKLNIAVQIPHAESATAKIVRRLMMPDGIFAFIMSRSGFLRSRSFGPILNRSRTSHGRIEGAPNY